MRDNFYEIHAVGITDHDNRPDAMDKAEGKALSNGEKVSDAEIYNESATGVKVVTAEESMRCRILKTIGLYLAFASIVSVLSHNNCVLHSAHCNLI